MADQLVIEYPAGGETYPADGEEAQYGVYRYGVYERGSVLQGRTKRTFIAAYDTLEEAQKKHPDAEWNGEGSGYVPVDLPENPPEWFDPDYAGERWGDDY